MFAKAKKLVRLVTKVQDLHSYFLLIGGYLALVAFCSSVRSNKRSSIIRSVFTMYFQKE